MTNAKAILVILSLGLGLLSLPVAVQLQDAAAKQSRTVKTTYPGGGPKSEWTEVLKDGGWVKEGSYKSWSEDGRISESGTYEDGVREGKWEHRFEWSWWEDSPEVVESGLYKDGQRTGVWLTTYAEGRVGMSATYAHDKEQGLWQVWNRQGVLIQQKTFDNGLEEGPALRFDSDGMLYVLAEMHKGKRSGLYVEYNTGMGSRIVQGEFEEGVRARQWYTWHDSGVLSSSSLYERGELHGLFESFHPNGIKSEEGQYVDGKKDGVWQRWGESGNLYESKTYKDGELQED